MKKSNSIFEKIKVGNYLYVFYEGNLIYKRWYNVKGEKQQPSAIFNNYWGMAFVKDDEYKNNETCP